MIDCGQFKALPRVQRVQLAELVLGVADYQDTEEPAAKLVAKEKLADLVEKFGVTVSEEYQNDVNLWCSVALFLFGNADQTLPGGYSANELDDKSPIKLVTSFPQELVLLGRATVLLKGIAKKLEVPFSLADKWGPGCALTLDFASKPSLPLWGKDVEIAVASSSPASGKEEDEKIRFQQVVKILKTWGKGKGTRFAERVIKKLPPNLRTKVLEYELRRQERKDLAAKEKKKN